MLSIFLMIIAFGGPHIDIHIPGPEEIREELQKELPPEPTIPVEDENGNIKHVPGV
jgi:hypothetical protein